MIGLWIAEGARAQGEEIGFLKCGRSDLVKAFGHMLVDGPGTENMRLGTGAKPYDDELRTAHQDQSPRTIRWQRSLSWNFEPRRPKINLAPDLLEWARNELKSGSAVIIAPKAHEGSRTAPLNKWLKAAWDLNRHAIRTVAIDANKSAVDAFPFFWYGLSWLHVAALIHESAVVAGNDSGIAHLSAAMGIPTVVMMGACRPEIVFGHCMENVTVLTGPAPCAYCHFSAARGFQAACDHGCDALCLVPSDQVTEAIISRMRVAV